MDYRETGEILKVIAHPARLKILYGLLRNECDVNGIVKKLGLPQSTISQHLGLLRNKGIIKPRKEGVRTCYSVENLKVREILRVLKK